MIVNILDDAEQDILDGFRFYGSQSSGAADYFLDGIYSDIDTLALSAGVHQKSKGYYRLLSKRFPYAVYYTVDQHQVYVWAVLDCRRNPAVIDERLGEL